MTINRVIMSVFLMLMPLSAYAYIDPGVMGAVFQSLYVLIFGFIMAWVIRPWEYIKSFFRSKESINTDRSAEEAKLKDKGFESKE